MPKDRPTPRGVRIGLALVVAVYVGYSAFGIAAPFFWGHHGYHGATYMLRARMSLRHHLVAPATYTGYDAPPPAALYFHHPVGYHHLLTATVPIFGEREWLPRALGALGGLAALYALYRLVRRAWSAWLGLAACAVYVAMPVVASFSILSDPMLLELACVLWGLRCYFDYLERPSRRLLAEAALSYAIGGLLMWEVFFIGPFVAVHGLLYARSLKGRAEVPWDGAPVELLALHRTSIHTLFIGSACVAVMAFHVWFTAHAGVWRDFLDSYQMRHTAPSGSYVLDRHTQWMELLYGAAPLTIGALWFIVFLARVALGRTRTRDLAPLTFLYTNTLYIYLFAEGSSVHLYRVFFYSGFFALAAIDLADDVGRFVGRLARSSARVAVIASASVIAAYLVAVYPHAYKNLLDSRVLMGTHGETQYKPHDDQWLFAKEITRLTSQAERVLLHYPSMGARKELWFYLDRSLDEITNMSQVEKYKTDAVLVYDDRTISQGERAIAERLMKTHPVRFYERFVLIDLRSDKPRVEGWAFVKGPMTPGYRFWVSHVYPPLSLVRRASSTGVCAALRLGLPIAKDEQPPVAEPQHAACFAQYMRMREAASGDTIEPPPPPPEGPLPGPAVAPIVPPKPR